MAGARGAHSGSCSGAGGMGGSVRGPPAREPKQRGARRKHHVRRRRQSSAEPFDSPRLARGAERKALWAAGGAGPVGVASRARTPGRTRRRAGVGEPGAQQALSAQRDRDRPALARNSGRSAPCGSWRDRVVPKGLPAPGGSRAAGAHDCARLRLARPGDWRGDACPQRRRWGGLRGRGRPGRAATGARGPRVADELENKAPAL